MIENIEKYKLGIIGGGRRCRDFLEAIISEPETAKRPVILGVADNDPDAVGFQLAREKQIFTTRDYRELFAFEELELLLELTPDDSLKAHIQAEKPPGVLVIDHYEARTLLDVFRIKARKNKMLETIRTGKGEGPDDAGLFEDFCQYVLDLSRDANAYGAQTRESLEKSEKTLSQIINGSSIPTFVIDRDHRITHWNRACEKLTGYAASKMIGSDDHWKPFRSKKQPTMADLVLQGVSQEDLWRLYGTRWEKSALIEGAYEVEEFFSHLGEEGRWLFFTAAAITASDGRVVGAIETLWDRTSHRTAEEAHKQKTEELARKVEELRANQETMAQIINGSTIPTFVIDKSHRVTHWNRALEKLSGYSADRVIGTRKQWAPFYERQRPSMADVILDQIDELRVKQLYGSKWRKSALIEGAYEAEVYFPHLGGEGKWCWFTAAPIKTPEGELVGAIETIWDKTEDRKAERERERHTRELAAYCSIYATLSGSLSLEGRVKAAIEEVAHIFMLDGICIYIRKPDGRFHLGYSHGFSDTLCFSNRIADDAGMVVRVAGKGAMTLFRDLSAEDAAGMDTFREEGFGSVVFLPITDKEKETFGVVQAASRKTDHFGHNELRSLELIANRIGVALENALLEQDIRRRAAFQAKLIGSSNDGIVATDAQGKVVIFNATAETILGYSAKEVLHQKEIRELLPAEIMEIFEKTMADGLTRERNLPWRETVVSASDGEKIPVRFSGSILHQKHRKMGLVAFFHDLREIKRLEKELVGAERLAAVGQTVAGMAHCVKNILHGLKGGSYMVNLGIEKNQTEKLKSGWTMVQRNIARTQDLVQDLLSYSKERQPEIALCRPNEIVAEVCELMESVAEENRVVIETHLSGGIGEGMLDQRSLHRSLLNMVSNAIDACRDDPDTEKTHRVGVTTAPEADGGIRFDITDNGSGMSDEVKARLFSSFFSTKGPQGTGLGLLVTGKLIEEHGGSIEAQSELGRGTTFSIRLPFPKTPPEIGTS